VKEKTIDIIIGKNIRIRRSLMGFSQSELGKRLGITFQQVQKYETGHNSVSPARLMQLSQIFSCGIAELFHELPSTGHEAALPDPSRKAINLINNFERIDDKDLQQQICDLVRTIADGRKRKH
jgi:transcriptional regulator with XRE-family HTH domain